MLDRIVGSLFRRAAAQAVCTLALTACALQPAPVPPQATLPHPSATAIPAASATPERSPTPLPSSTAAATESTGGPPHPANPLWLANAADGTLLVIDSADNSTAVLIPTGLNPDRVVLSESDAWALDPSADALIQIDRQTYTIRNVIHFAQQDVNALAVGEGYVWVGVTERSDRLILKPKEEYRPSGGVLRIDPLSAKTTGYAQLGPVSALAVSAGAIWALQIGAVDTPLARIDPATLRQTPIALSRTPDWLLADTFSTGPGGLWIFSHAFGKLYHASPDGQVYAELTLGQHKPLGPSVLLEAFGAIWLSTPWGSLLRIDPSTQQVQAEIPLNAPITTLLETGDAVWAISPALAAAYRIDPRSNTVSTTAALGSRVQPTPALTPTAVHRASQPCEDSPLSRLSVGMRAVTPGQPALPNRLHQEAAKDSPVSGYIQPGQRVEILEGPQCNENWVWWRVKSSATGATGWAAEGDTSNYWLIPAP